MDWTPIILLQKQHQEEQLVDLNTIQPEIGNTKLIINIIRMIPKACKYMEYIYGKTVLEVLFSFYPDNECDVNG